MSEQDHAFFAQSLHGVAQAQELISRLFRIAEPGAVYSAPITTGERTVIVTSEISMSVGAGAGFGSNTAPAAVASSTAAAALASSGGPVSAPAEQPAARDESGGGGGGGGFSFGRPVAAIVIEPTGVRVEPIVDPTKLGIAFFTTLGAMFFAWTALRRTRNELTARQLALAARTGVPAGTKLEGDLRRLSRAEKRAAKKAAKETAKEAARLAAAESKKITALAAKESKKAAEKAAKAAAGEARKAAELAAKEAQAAKNAARMTAQAAVESRPWQKAA
jgi:uncharacterized spore protein YtfJ